MADCSARAGKVVRVLLTGPPGIGKTTVCKKVNDLLIKNLIKTKGFYTEEVRSEQRTGRLGFDVVTLDGKRSPLARLKDDDRRQKGPSVGRYVVDLKSFESLALPAIKHLEEYSTSSSVVIVDEIGKMELFSKPFSKGVLKLFESQASILATVPVAKQHPIQLVEQLKQRVDMTLVENHKIERIWVEMNLRVNYPIKWILNKMVNDELLDMEDDVTKFSVSYVALRVCKEGCRQVIDAWNAHHIPGSCRPNELEALNNKAAAIPIQNVPTTAEAVKMYEENGGQLTYWQEFGSNPLASSPILLQSRLNDFNSAFPDMAILFHGVANGYFLMFIQAIQSFRDVTMAYAAQVANV